MDDTIIGPNPCYSCGGDYGRHSKDCAVVAERVKREQDKEDELRGLATMFVENVVKMVKAPEVNDEYRAAGANADRIIVALIRAVQT